VPHCWRLRPNRAPGDFAPGDRVANVSSMSIVHQGVSAAQIVFSIALGLVTLGIIAFAVYVVAQTTRTTRWFRRHQ